MDIVYWEELGKRIGNRRVAEDRISYRISPFTQWKVLVADESSEVKKGEVRLIKLREVRIPQNTIIAPLSIMPHAHGLTFDVVERGLTKVEGEKTITHSIFLPIEDGFVEKGDIVGVLKVFFVRTGVIGKRLGFKSSDIRIREEMVDANLTWKDGGEVRRERIRTRFFGYFRSHVAEWEPIIAAESCDVEEGVVARIKIKEIRLPENTVVTPLSIRRHPLGTVLDVIQPGRRRKVEEEKRITEAAFIPTKSGRIKRRDLLGVINVYYIATERFSAKRREKEETLARIVSEDEKREEIRISPFAYRRKTIARWEMIIADENCRVRRGEVKEIAIRPIKLEENTVVYPLYIMRNAFGSVVDVIEKRRSRVEEKKEINKAIFLPVFDGEIKRGQLLGVVNVYSVEVQPYEVIWRWLEEWQSEFSKIFAEVVG
ncbi:MULTISPECIES: DUF22 domain-containing protein [unclassified Archaeoglobus]|jgi:hypothetical protein|uniref:DUF22 domain-containing protein n=1 Tax=unclassified Archaeoglobus TaxID=2643606 RepID=UPI0025C4605F|nr:MULTISPECIES: DUF22 domain-containing protein [unclassified Archaeoglobus]